MELIVAQTAGFCFGVKRAVDLVYQEIEQHKEEQVYTYGPVIHNEEVIKDLELNGVIVLNTEEEIQAAEPGTVIIRAHGVPTHIYECIQTAGHRTIDATCPYVLKIHKIVREASARGDYIVIIGDSEHPEVMGIKSCAGHNSIVIKSPEEAEYFSANLEKKHKKLCVVSQTTFNFNKFQELVEIFRKNSYHIVDVLNTICNATEERQAEAHRISREVDTMIVIGGKNSSNTQKLFEICKEECMNTFYIQTAEDMDFSKISGKVGITAGASTPKKIIEEVQTRCQS